MRAGPSPPRRAPVVTLALALAMSVPCGCRQDSTPDKDTMPMNAQPIESVLEKHAPELMAIPGVVGVYQGQLEDGRSCITVMVIAATPELEAKIPRSLDGHPVVIEAGGKIEPLGGSDSL